MERTWLHGASQVPRRQAALPVSGEDGQVGVDLAGDGRDPLCRVALFEPDRD